MTSKVIQIDNLSFSYNGQAVLNGVNLDIVQGDFIAMIGPNGGGKSTLLKLILGLLKPDTGKITVMGKPAVKASSCIGYVPQDVNLNRNFPITALDIVLMGKLKPEKRWKRQTSTDRDEAMTALEKMGMADYAKRKISNLSGGQRQRVFIARALVTQPQILLLDEPTSSIDTKGQTDFFKMLKKLNKEITILVVSHNLFVVSSFVKSVICLNRHLHYHSNFQFTGSDLVTSGYQEGRVADMLEKMYACTVEEVCPVEMIAHQMPPDEFGRS
ncbi:MAG: ABC transporter ATP-binding protein [Desulfamplus sp.]|nr:ABC transporter ATP-binding protein [Desulfamplus sp.]MBF0411320.1 ABC transporter ATP-binding protein [Desulfamplus sp.]